MRGSLPDYKIDEEAMFKARPAWVSADENRDMVQNEIMLESSNKQNKFSIGRSNRRDVELKLKAVSADHCKIEYSKDKGWLIHEQGKDRLSSNGTFVFMKSHQQMEDHEPSDMIPLFNGMIISFINYELQVRIEPKSQEEIANSHFENYPGLAPSVHCSVNPTPRDDLKSSVAPSYKPDPSPVPSKPVSVIHSDR
jgi:predicted component of type VI protein secretion system